MYELDNIILKCFVTGKCTILKLDLEYLVPDKQDKVTVFLLWASIFFIIK